MVKVNRQLKILEIIEKMPIETQEELSLELKKSGFDITQATVSRDIKELRLLKVLGESGKYKYISPAKDQNADVSAKFRIIFKESVISVDCANNLIIIKTLPGMAQAAASTIDSIGWENIMGSLAGDDTIFVAAKDNDNAITITQKFKDILRG